MIVYLGDASVEEGVFFESLNFAIVKKIPVIFVCENNQFAVTTSYKDSVSVENISDRASAYNMPGLTIDGQDVMAMYEATNEAVIRARNGEGPTLIEGLTYRFEDHSVGLANVRKGGPEYRTEEYLNTWKHKDPIILLKTTLISQNIATQEECDAIENEEKKNVENALEFARKSPYPEPEQLFEDMWSTPIPQP